MTTDPGTLALGALADALVADILRGDDLQHSVAVRAATDLVSAEPPRGLWTDPRGDRQAFDRFAPRPGHRAHMDIDDVRRALVGLRFGRADEGTRDRLREFFTAISASTLAAATPPGCGSSRA